MPPGPRPRTGARATLQRADATPSQLDIIAEINARAAGEHRGRLARRIAVVGGATLLGAGLWWFVQGGAVHAPAPLQPVAALPAEAQRNKPAAAAPAKLDQTAAAAPTLPDAAAAPAQDALPASAPTQATAVSLAESAAAARQARKARAAALQLQQERSRAQAQGHLQRDAEREAQQAREMADAASRHAAEPAPAPAQPAAEPRRGVRERCSASSNIVSELFCQSRECRKPEHANDAVCIRLRAIEPAQPSGGH
jgi:hypothetical protein